MIKGVLLDLSGVVYDGDHAIPGALAAISRIRESGLPLRFITNSTRATKASLLQRLEHWGLTVESNELFTPASAAIDWLRNNNRSPHLLVHPNLRPEFAAVERGKALAVIVGDAGDDFGYAELNRAFRLVADDAPLLALAMNRTFKDADGHLSLDAGPFVRALEYASNRKALLLGKPSVAFYSASLASIGCQLGEAAMVGDDAEADVAGALTAGLHSALLVRTGKYRLGDEKRFTPSPTATVADLSAAADWVIAHQA